MAIVRYNPLSELRSMQDRMNRLLDLAWTREIGDEIREGLWHPPADIYEDDAGLTVKVELPDMELEEIEMKFEAEENILTIRGERRHGEQFKKENFHRIERYFGPFCRSFSLPGEVDGGRMTASCDCGVLTITIPRTGVRRPRSGAAS